MEIDQEQFQEMLDLKKVEVLQELMSRLAREMQAYGVLSQQIAWAKSKAVTDALELTVPDADAEEPVDGNPVEVLAVRRRKVMEAMRASLYAAANRMKQYTQQGKDAHERHRAEAEKEA
jgi:hypothetical protein